MTISIWMAVVIAIITLMAGFWLGRSIRWMVAETREQLEKNGNCFAEELQNEQEFFMEEMEKSSEKQVRNGKIIASPVSGVVRSFCEGSRCGALIYPDNGHVYAPVSGRVTRLYPMGTAMQITTEQGRELLLKVGGCCDELYSMCYRARVMQNEIINKGKLILEFDKEELEARGMDVTVSLSVDSGESKANISVTTKERIKVGEELLWLS